MLQKRQQSQRVLDMLQIKIFPRGKTRDIRVRVIGRLQSKKFFVNGHIFHLNTGRLYLVKNGGLN
jgi:hypothetical protein